MALARQIAEQPPVPNRLVKGMVRRGLNDTLEEHLIEGAEVEVLTLTTDDHKEALAAFKEKRKGRVQGEVNGVIIPSVWARRQRLFPALLPPASSCSPRRGRTRRGRRALR